MSAVVKSILEESLQKKNLRIQQRRGKKAYYTKVS